MVEVDHINTVQLKFPLTEFELLLLHYTRYSNHSYMFKVDEQKSNVA